MNENISWHIIEGKAGCEYAVSHRCVAIVVDALRASATAARLLEEGATELHMVKDVDAALALKAAAPDVLLFGERGGLPPEGFDGGNSPRRVSGVNGRTIVFTTTTGSTRLVDCWGAEAIYMGSTLNASAVAELAGQHGVDVVVIPAGLSSDPNFLAQEDWVAATVIAANAHADVGLGMEQFRYWSHRIDAEGVSALFESAPHAAKLRKIGLQDDISFCAHVDLSSCTPVAVHKTDDAVVVRRAEHTLRTLHPCTVSERAVT